MNPYGIDPNTARAILNETYVGLSIVVACGIGAFVSSKLKSKRDKKQAEKTEIE